MPDHEALGTEHYCLSRMYGEQRPTYQPVVTGKGVGLRQGFIHTLLQTFAL